MTGGILDSNKQIEIFNIEVYAEDTSNEFKQTNFTMYKDHFKLFDITKIEFTSIISLHTKDDINILDDFKYLLRIKLINQSPNNNPNNIIEKPNIKSEKSVNYANSIEKEMALLMKSSIQLNKESVSSNSNNIKKTKLLEDQFTKLLIIKFNNIHQRDFTKTALLVICNKLSSTTQLAIEGNLTMTGINRLKQKYKNSKVIINKQTNILPSSRITSSYETLFTKDLCSSTSSFVLMLLNNRIICNIFLSSNTPLSHFFSIYTNSYFYCSDNKPNSLDQSLNLEERNFAKRINKFSSTKTTTANIPKVKYPKIAKEYSGKKVNFDYKKIILSYTTASKDDGDRNVEDIKLNPFDILNNIPDENISQYKSDSNIKIEYKDYETAIELSKVAYNNSTNIKSPGIIEEVKNYTEEFKQLILEKYGKNILDKSEYLLPINFL